MGGYGFKKIRDSRGIHVSQCVAGTCDSPENPDSLFGVRDVATWRQFFLKKSKKK